MAHKTKCVILYVQWIVMFTLVLFKKIIGNPVIIFYLYDLSAAWWRQVYQRRWILKL